MEVSFRPSERPGYITPPVLEVAERGGMPVLITVAGFLPDEQILIDGQPFVELERIVIRLGISGESGLEPLQFHYSDAEVERHEAGWVQGKVRHVPLGRFPIDARTPEAAVQQALVATADAVARGVQLDVAAEYTAAAARVAFLRTLPHQLTRQEYEDACQQQGIEALSDMDIDQANQRDHSMPRFPDHSPEELVRLHLDRRRLRAFREETDRFWLMVDLGPIVLMPE